MEGYSPSLDLLHRHTQFQSGGLEPAVEGDEGGAAVGGDGEVEGVGRAQVQLRAVHELGGGLEVRAPTGTVRRLSAARR